MPFRRRLGGLDAADWRVSCLSRRTGRPACRPARGASGPSIPATRQSVAISQRGLCIDDAPSSYRPRGTSVRKVPPSAIAATLRVWSRSPAPGTRIEHRDLTTPTSGLSPSAGVIATGSGPAVQLGTLRFLGMFLADPTDVPLEVVVYVAGQSAPRMLRAWMAIWVAWVAARRALSTPRRSSLSTATVCRAIDRSATTSQNRDQRLEFELMTTRERLHKLVDELSEQEADEALQLIAARRGNDFARWLDSLPRGG